MSSTSGFMRSLTMAEKTEPKSDGRPLHDRKPDGPQWGPARPWPREHRLFASL